MFRKLAVLVFAVFVSACSSTVHMQNESGNYAYKNEKYGNINVILADEISSDPSKTTRANQVNLEDKIKARLQSLGVYDETSTNKIDVVVSKLRVRNAFNAIMFGFMSGSDNLGGTVTLKDGQDNQISTFDISASYAMGGIAGGQNDARLGWLGDEFAELTANTIVGKNTN